MSKELTKVFCHHCGQLIVWNRCDGHCKGYWAHPITVFNGKAHTIGNALMEQRCANKLHWATPKRPNLEA